MHLIHVNRALPAGTVVAFSAFFCDCQCMMGSPLRKYGYASLERSFSTRHGQTYEHCCEMWVYGKFFSFHRVLSYSFAGQGLLV